MGGTYGPWGDVLKTLKGYPADTAKARRVALRYGGEFLRAKIVEGLREQAPGGKKFKPLSPQTLAVRKFTGFKGTKALLRNGDLRNGVKVNEVGIDSVFVGALRTARNSRGQSLADIFALNEFGSKPIVIKMTPKMAAFLHAAFTAYGLPRPDRHKVSTGVIVVQIPARPFIGPVMDKYGEEATKKFTEKFTELMKANGHWVAYDKVK